MPRNITLKLQYGPEKRCCSYSFTLSEDEEALLNEYDECARALATTRDPIHRALMTIDRSNPRDIKIRDIVLPPSEKMDSLLHRLRPLILKNEPTYFLRVLNLLARKIRHRSFEAEFRSFKEIFLAKRIQNKEYVVTKDGIIINSDDTLMNWLNAFEYHRDKKKRGLIETLLGEFPADAARVIFIQILYDKVVAILMLNNIVRVSLGKEKTVGRLVTDQGYVATGILQSDGKYA